MPAASKSGHATPLFGRFFAGRADCNCFYDRNLCDFNGEFDVFADFTGFSLQSGYYCDNIRGYVFQLGKERDRPR